MSSLNRLGWTTFFQGELAQLRTARVVEEQRRLYRVSGDFDGLAEVSGRFRHEATSAADFPAVGDWVGVAAEPDADRGVIHRRFERRSAISRNAAGRAVNEQVLAANIDTVFVVTALTHDLNPRRLERYLTMVWESGVLPVVLLNKADLCEDPPVAAAAMRERLPFVEVLAVSALNVIGIAALIPHLRPAKTVALLGSSGVGKSTIVNCLLGRELQRVAAVRDVHGKGRHMTLLTDRGKPASDRAALGYIDRYFGTPEKLMKFAAYYKACAAEWIKLFASPLNRIDAWKS